MKAAEQAAREGAQNTAPSPDVGLTPEDLVPVDEWTETGPAEVVLDATPSRKRPASPTLPQPVSKRPMEPAAARECAAVTPQHHTPLHPGLVYAPPGLNALNGLAPWHIPLPQYQRQAYVHNSVMPFLSQMQALIPRTFPHPQIAAPQWDPRDFELNVMRAGVQRLLAENELLKAGKRLAEQTSDTFRKELEALLNQSPVVTLKERNVELLKSIEELAHKNSQLNAKLNKKPNSDVDSINGVLLRSQIVKLSLEKEASDAQIGELRTLLAAEQSKNAEPEVQIQWEECQDLQIRLESVRQVVGCRQNSITVSTSPPTQANKDCSCEKSAPSAELEEGEIRSSPASRDSTPELQDVVTSRALHKGNNSAQNLSVIEIQASNTGNAAVPKGLKELTTYFRTLEDHGLSPEEIVEYIRRKYPDMANQERALIELLHDFRANVHEVINNSTGYERLRQVVNKSSKVLEFYDFLAYLLRNGTLGRCLDQMNGSFCDVYVNMDSSKFSEELADFLEPEYVPRKHDDFLNSFIPYWGMEQDYLMRHYAERTFEYTWNSYDYLQYAIRDQLEAAFIKKEYLYKTDLRTRCRGFAAANIDEEDSPPSDVTMNFLASVVGPNCETNSTASLQGRLAALQSAWEKYANKFNFTGDTSNRCLQNFVIRYNNYSVSVYERFAGDVSEYLYQDTVLHGLCLSFDKNGRETGEKERSRRREWIIRKLSDIRNWLMESRSVFEEAPPTTKPATASWSSQAKAVVEGAVGNDVVSYPRSEDDLNRYKAIYEKIQAGLANISVDLNRRSNKAHTFDVLVYSHSFDTTDHCVNASKPVISGQFRNVNYVVSLREEAVPSWIQDKNATMQKYYSESDEPDLCKRIAEVSRKMSQELVGHGSLSAVVAVKCARRFVWYELAYQYFAGVYTEAPAIEVKPESRYNSNCGHLVLFP